jgi:hypothetical protein
MGMQKSSVQLGEPFQKHEDKKALKATVRQVVE